MLKLLRYIFLVLSIFSLLPVFLFPNSVQAITSWYDSGWAYRKYFTVNGSTAGGVTNYQIKLTVNFGQGADTGNTVYLNSKSQIDFDDLRFTKSDGVTLLDAWLESYIASSVCTVWVELDILPVSPGTNTFYIYYGNAYATSNWNGSNTFISFDDFERGVDGDPIGGSWTVSSGVATISSDQNYYSSLSAKVTGNATTSQITIPRTAIAKYAIQVQTYKENATGNVTYFHGDGTQRMYIYANDTEDMRYFAGAVDTDTTQNTVADAWRRWEFVNFDWSTHVYTFYHNDTLIGTGYAMNTSASQANVVALENADATAGDDVYFDNFIIRNYVTPEPSVYLWSAVEIATAPLAINSAKVYSSYRNTNDWLIAISYTNFYEPYYRNGANVAEYFYLQLLDTSGTTVIAQTKVPAWGYRPGCIYLSATSVTPLTWGSSYKIRLFALFSPNPYIEYTLLPADWQGSNLILLDAWVRSTAVLIENYYSVTLTSYIAGKGITLNEDGGVIFSDGISALDTVRPNLFQIVSITPSQTQGTYTQLNQPVWQTIWGTQITAMFTQAGNLISVDGRTVGAILAFVTYFCISIFAFSRATAVAAIGIPFVVLLIAWNTGLLAMALLGVILSIASFILIWQFWLKGG